MRQVFYRIATPFDIPEIASYMATQSSDDRNMYFGHTASEEYVRSLYKGFGESMDQHVFVLAKAWTGGIVGIVHLAQAGKKIELGIFVSPTFRGEGVGSTLLAMGLMYSFSLMHKDLIMQCVNRNYDIQHLIADYDKTMETYDDEKVAVLPYTTANLVKVFSKLGRNLWNF